MTVRNQYDQKSDNRSRSSKVCSIRGAAFVYLLTSEESTYFFDSLSIRKEFAPLLE